MNSDTPSGHLRKTLLIGLVAFLLSLLTLTPTLSPFELKAFDLCSRLLNPAVTSDNIVMVVVDQPSLEALAAEGVTWPWPRQIYAPVIEYLAQAEAVYFDVLFTEASSYGDEDDRILAEAIRKAGNVTLPLFVTATRKGSAAADEPFLKRVSLAGSVPRAPTYPAVLAPIPVLAGAARNGGNVMIKPDQDGVYRRVPLLFGADGLLFPNLILGDLLKNGKLTLEGDRICRAGRPLPLQDEQLLLRFSSAREPFRIIPVIDLIRATSGADPAPRFTRDFFRGKRVLIGLTAAGLYDLKPTAVSSSSFGTLVHATTLENLLKGTSFRPVPLFWSLLVMLLFSLAAARFVLTHSAVAANLTFFGVALVCSLGLPAALFACGHYLRLLPPVTAMTTAFVLAASYSYATEGRERRFVRRAFSQYMDETLVAHLLQHPELIRPGGQKKRVTVFFADIAGFTTIAERFPVDDTARMLHGVLNALSEEIIRNHGVIDKYIGDCVMAFWGAPLESGQDEANACRAALACLDALVEVNRGFTAEGLGEISLRIGLHTGDAIVGNLGSDRLFDFTVVGDTVNLASRLESANKFFHTRCMASEDTIRSAGNDIIATRELGLIAVKGKQHPVRIFEIVGYRASMPPEELELCERYNRAVLQFRDRQWQEAEGEFAAIQALMPGDGPSQFYLEWCRRLIAREPLTDDWDVIIMTDK